MNRRAFLRSAACVVLAAPLEVEAQQAASTRVIGYLGNADQRFEAPNIKALRQGLRDLGWIEGETVRIEYRWADGSDDRIPELIAELVRLKVDVLVVAGPVAVRAAREATSTIPIVMRAFLADPVSVGFVKSLARPGGNITGVVSQFEDLVTKQVELLSETIPQLSRLFVLRHPSSSSIVVNAAVAAAERRGLKVQVLEVKDVAKFEGAFRTARKAGGQAIHVLPNPFFNTHRRQLVELAARYRLPAVYEFRGYVQDGGLFSYGPSIPEMHRRAASYVDRILKGANPAEMPVERATMFELVINLKTAKALGLTIPPSLLLRADEVLQ